MVDVCHCIRTENDCTLVYLIVHKQQLIVTTTYCYNNLLLQQPIVTTTYCYNNLLLQQPIVTTT